MVVTADVADFEAVDQAAHLIERHFGPIDVWVNAAFSTIFAPFDKIDPNEFKRATEVSYLGFVHGTMAALNRMKRATAGQLCRSARRWACDPSRCNRHTAAQNTPSTASRNLCGPN